MDYVETYGSTAAAGGIIAAVVGIIGFLLVVGLAIYILAVIGQWKVLTKAGEKGWKALIPVYNSYTLCQIAGVNPWWILIVFGAGIVGGVIPVIGGLVSLAASLYFSILLSVSLARSFGKEDSFAIGLVLLGPVFYMILGFDKSKYVGKKPMDDFVLNFFNQKTSNNNQKSAASTNVKSDEPAKFCSGCGTKLSEDDKFCPSCGKNL